MSIRIYVETSVISYLANRPSRDGLVAARQALTHDWWAGLDSATVWVSELVVAEVSRGDLQAAGNRLRWIENLPRVEIEPQAMDLAQRLMDEGLVPKTEAEDAMHIALASVHDFDYLVSWNFAHFVGADTKYRLFSALRDWGLNPVRLVTPEELMEGLPR
jgi:predicted nucleic acid-binding protein